MIYLDSLISMLFSFWHFDGSAPFQPRWPKTTSLLVEVWLHILTTSDFKSVTVSDSGSCFIFQHRNHYYLWSFVKYYSRWITVAQIGGAIKWHCLYIIILSRMILKFWWLFIWMVFVGWVATPATLLSSTILMMIFIILFDCYYFFLQQVIIWKQTCLVIHKQTLT